MPQTDVVSRRKLWDLPDLQCPVIGTCLTVGELRKLSRKVLADLEADAGDFELHSYFVYKCKSKGVVAQRVHKLLDKKYRRDIRRFAKAKSQDELEAMWAESLAEGDIPGPFWAVMSHPQAGQELINRAFGEVHMLSHLVGSANRADIRRLSRLEADLDREKAKVDAARKALRAVVARKKDETSAARRESLQLRKDNARLMERIISYESLDVNRRLKDLEAVNCMLKEKVARAEVEARESQAELKRIRADAAVKDGRMARLVYDLSVKTEEVASLESAMQQLLAEGACANCPEDPSTCPKLFGKCILYVGGRTSMVQHYRSLVEKSGGEFLHHDGGDEGSMYVLGGALSRADYVMFPVDCVSHEASTHIKRMCKSAMKPYVPLRSSGLSSLARGLSEVSV